MFVMMFILVEKVSKTTRDVGNGDREIFRPEKG